SASAALYAHPAARGLFKWDPTGDKDRPLARRDPDTRQVVSAGKPLQDWLRDVLPHELRDIFGCPTVQPCPAEKSRPEAPERWGVWVDAHPTLREWRGLVRAAGVAAVHAEGAAIRAKYEVVPYLRPVSPSLSALRAI